MISYGLRIAFEFLDSNCVILQLIIVPGVVQRRLYLRRDGLQILSEPHPEYFGAFGPSGREIISRITGRTGGPQAGGDRTSA